MFSGDVVEALNGLGNLALIIIVPFTLYNSYTSMKISILLFQHLESDKQKFKEIDQHFGRLDIQVDEVRMAQAKN